MLSGWAFVGPGWVTPIDVAGWHHFAAGGVVSTCGEAIESRGDRAPHQGVPVCVKCISIVHNLTE